MDIRIEKATIADVPKIHKLVNDFADRGEMLHRSLAELYENVRDFMVIRDGEELAGCASVHVVWADLAEIKAVAVSEEHQDQGLGQTLMQACIEEARRLGIATVFVLTHKPGYYEKLGFQLADVMHLPRKVWGECLRCPKFPHCNELALVMHLQPDGSAVWTQQGGVTVQELDLIPAPHGPRPRLGL
ncbi:MAG: N-acetyltransferase [Chloroflexi bacterium]|nr:N-acetyltransferase [Chloroflexota bacterium]